MIRVKLTWSTRKFLDLRQAVHQRSLPQTRRPGDRERCTAVHQAGREHLRHRPAWDNEVTVTFAADLEPSFDNVHPSRLQWSTLTRQQRVRRWPGVDQHLASADRVSVQALILNHRA